MSQEPTIKVTKIKNRWHARLLFNGGVFDEMACKDSRDIAWICREMLRWYVKTGGVSEYAKAERKKHSNTVAFDQVWYRNEL